MCLAREAERADKPAYYQALYRAHRPLMEQVARQRTQYYGEVTLIDDSVGKILRTLDDLKLRQNTMIVFMSDHGDMLGDHFLFYKGPYHYRQCASAPLMVNWAGRVRKGRVVGGIVQAIAEETAKRVERGKPKVNFPPGPALFPSPR